MRRGELRLAVLRGQRPAAVLSRASAAGAVRCRRASVTPPFYTYDHSSRLRGDRRPVLHGHRLPAAVPGQLLLRRLHRELHQAGRVRLPSNSRSRCSRSRPTSRHPVALDSGSRRDDLLPVVHDRARSGGSASTDRSRRRQRHADQRLLAAHGVVLERRLGQPGRRARSPTSGTSATARPRPPPTRSTPTRRRASRTFTARLTVTQPGRRCRRRHTVDGDRRQHAADADDHSPRPTARPSFPGRRSTYQGSATDPEDGALAGVGPEVDGAAPPQHPRPHVRRGDRRSGQLRGRGPRADRHLLATRSSSPPRTAAG